MRNVIAVRSGSAGRDVIDLLPGLPEEPMLGAQDWAALIIDVALALREPEIARPAVALLERTLDRGMLVSSSLAALSAWIAGDGHALLGEVDSARRRYAEAIRLADRSGARTERRSRASGSPVWRWTTIAGVAIETLRRTLPLLERAGLRPGLVEATTLAQELGFDRGRVTGRARKPVSETSTVLFVDVVDSTRLTEELGDIEYRDRARVLDGRLRLLIAEHGGSAMPGINLGDGLVAVVPVRTRCSGHGVGCGAGRGRLMFCGCTSASTTERSCARAMRRTGAP